jgi:hypothetical protein
VTHKTTGARLSPERNAESREEKGVEGHGGASGSLLVPEMIAQPVESSWSLSSQCHG